MFNIMQAVILSGGKSSRFWPLNSKHKSLTKVCGKTLVEWTIKGLKKSGIDDIIIIQGPNKNIEIELKDKYPEIKFAVQPKPKGMGNALSQAENLIKKDFFTMHAHCFDADKFIKPMIEKQKSTGSKLILVGKKTDKLWKYGIVGFDSRIQDKIIKLVEKPKKGEEQSDIGLKGIYLLSKEFFEYYKKTK
ncbi:MAG: NTP transferase domain-containing protein, partial [Candidatus Aenigmarchaeota archaeon]|nr:NTP transferase domain-containing protein [Candidatus Aenigmarchaeota archaeon]